jgi:FKBP-type peptidyl-prolyl cis-trans isomerase FklB
MKKVVFALSLSIMLVAAASGQVNKEVSYDNPLKTEMDSLSYSFGLLIGNNLMTQGVKEVNQNLFMTGFNSGYLDQEAFLSMETANQFIQDYFNKQISEEANMNLQKSNEFLAANQAKEGVVTLPSGLQYKIITPGTGEMPKSTDQVRVHYHGTFIDGKVFDSSIDRNEPIVFGVDQVIPGWTEGLQLMQTGARWMLYIPPALAYGEQGAGGVIGPNQALVFEVELIEIVKE